MADDVRTVRAPAPTSEFMLCSAEMVGGKTVREIVRRADWQTWKDNAFRAGAWKVEGEEMPEPPDDGAATNGTTLVSNTRRT